MWPAKVVVVAPLRQFDANLMHCDEERFVQLLVTLSSGEASDCKGSDSDTIRSDLAAREVEAVIPTRRNHKTHTPIDGAVHAVRNLIERCFNKLKPSRRFATRYDKATEICLGFVLIASARMWCRHVVNTAEPNQ